MTILSYLAPGLIQLVVGILQLPHKTQHKPALHDLRNKAVVLKHSES